MTLNLEKYNYKLPERLIAQEPAVPRDSSRLLFYNREEKKIVYDTFLNIGDYLPERAVLVFNETKVIPARVFLKKETGGKTEILYLGQKDNLIEVLANRKLRMNSFLYLNQKKVFLVVDQKQNIYYLKPLFSDVKGFFEKYGIMPIPPYIKNTPLSKKELRKKYQAVFAKKTGSSAAPTASLHFTNRLLKKLKNDKRFLTLHVGLGTFAPLNKENIKKKKLHEEYYSIDEKTALFLNKARKEGRLIVAVGTTVARALESASRKGKLKSLSGQTSLFIQEGYKFDFIDGLITNFHLPKSSLLMLVSAFTGRRETLDIYNKAIKKNFRFYSFGDGMLIL